MPTTDDTHRLEKDALGPLIRALRRRGYRVVGPTLRDGAIVYDAIEAAEDLPVGWTDSQEAGHYRLERRGDDARFGYAVGPHSWKKLMFPAEERLFRLRIAGDGPEPEGGAEDAPAYALIGVRACEIAALRVQDRVFLGEPAPDPRYGARRERAFIVAVSCAEPAGTCFCASMGTGPELPEDEGAFDLALVEVCGDGDHYFTARAGSERGSEVLAELPARGAADAEVAGARAVTERARRRMGRALDTTDIANLLYRNLEHPRWDEVADRCLSCANCTIVCPTCFCHSVDDTTDLSGEHVERWRRWDSCFTSDHSYLHGGAVRQSIRSRYRQWMTHKLGTWIWQFGTSGCVGCGRCITWCPVGIDITEETRAIRETDGARPSGEEEP